LPPDGAVVQGGVTYLPEDGTFLPYPPQAGVSGTAAHAVRIDEGRRRIHMAVGTDGEGLPARIAEIITRPGKGENLRPEDLHVVDLHPRRLRPFLGGNQEGKNPVGVGKKRGICVSFLEKPEVMDVGYLHSGGIIDQSRHVGDIVFGYGHRQGRGKSEISQEIQIPAQLPKGTAST